MNRVLFLFTFIYLFCNSLVAKNRFSLNQIFLCKDSKDMVNVGLQDNPSTNFCYHWESSILLDDPTAPNPKLLEIPTTSTLIAVTVIDDNGDMFVEQIKIIVYELRFEIRHPRFMDSKNAQNLLSVNHPYTAAQTFVNIDNDDNDDLFDIDDKNVVGGDNELAPIKASITIYGADLPTFSGIGTANKGAFAFDDVTLSLRPIASANTVCLWRKESKEDIFNQYSLTYSNNDFLKSTSNGNQILTATIWAEGIVAHTQKNQAKFELNVAGDISAKNNCNVKVVSLTVCSIKSIEWIGVENGEGSNNTYNSNSLSEYTMEFTNPDNTIQKWANTSVRVFPDGRYINNVVSESKDKVNVKITLSTDMNDAFTLYVKSFDMDDPSQNFVEKDDKNRLNRPPGAANGKLLILDPNDDEIIGTYLGGEELKYTKDNDNRTKEKKVGIVKAITEAKKLITPIGADDIFSIYFNELIESREDIEFKVSQYPGDNYALYAYCDRSFLTNLYNRDKWDEDRIVDLTNSGERKECKNSRSKILTVWRLLHIESDEMRAVTQKDNEVGVFFSNFTSSQNSIKKIQRLDGMGSFKMIQTCECAGIKDDTDNTVSLSISPYLRKGRFENGLNTKLLIGVSEDYQNAIDALAVSNIEGNGDNFIKFLPNNDLSLENLKCTIRKDSKIMECKLVDGEINNGVFQWTLKRNTTTNIFLDFIGGQVSFGNSNESFKIETLVDNGNIGLITTNSFKIYALLSDDDNNNSDAITNSKLDFTEMKTVFENAFIQYVLDGGGDENNNEEIKFYRNLPKNGYVECVKEFYENSNQSKGLEKDNFWICYTNRLWQPKTEDDYDGNDGNADLGFTSQYYDNLSQDVSILYLTKGLEVSTFFRETILDYMKNSPIASTFKFKEAGTVAHEIGHQFGLSHGDVIDDNELGLNSDIDMGIMGRGGAQVNARFSDKLMPFHLNLIRSRKASPGRYNP